MSDVRRGARKSLDGKTTKKVTVEVGVEIGLMVDVEVTCFADKIDREDTEKQVTEKIIDIFNIDNKDKVLNNTTIYSIQ
jgi:hypothetical protein